MNHVAQDSSQGTVTAASPASHKECAGLFCLDARRAAAVAVLVNGGTCQDAAEAAGVCRRTITRWFAEPRFVEAIEAKKRELVVVRRALVDLMADEKVDARLKLRAAELLSSADGTRKIGEADIGDREAVVNMVKNPVVRLKRFRRMNTPSPVACRFRSRHLATSRGQEAEPEAPGPA